MITAYKVTRANGRDFATDAIDYSVIGSVVEWRDGGKRCECVLSGAVQRAAGIGARPGGGTGNGRA